MIIIKKHLSRRTFIRGTFGAAMALPLLDAMVPALTAETQTAAGAPFRFGAIYMPNGVFPDTDVYDPLADMWRVMAPMRTPRHGTGAAGVGNKLYVPGGATAQGGGTATAILEAFTLP